MGIFLISEFSWGNFFFAIEMGYMKCLFLHGPQGYMEGGIFEEIRMGRGF